MAIRPLGHRILVQPDPIEDKLKTEWGFELLADKKLERSIDIRGTLVGAGEQAWKAFSSDFTGKPWAKVGDRILFAQHAGRFIEDPETKEEYLIMNDDDLIAVITGEYDE